MEKVRPWCSQPSDWGWLKKLNILSCSFASFRTKLTLAVWFVRSFVRPVYWTMSNEFNVKFRPFDKVETNWTCSVCFDIVAETGNIVAKNSNNVETTFDFVERIVRLVGCSIRQCCFDVVAGVDRALSIVRWLHRCKCLDPCAAPLTYLLTTPIAFGWNMLQRSVSRCTSCATGPEWQRRRRHLNATTTTRRSTKLWSFQSHKTCSRYATVRLYFMRSSPHESAVSVVIRPPVRLCCPAVVWNSRKEICRILDLVKGFLVASEIPLYTVSQKNKTIHLISDHDFGKNVHRIPLFLSSYYAGRVSAM